LAASTVVTTPDELGLARGLADVQLDARAHASAVSWGAIVAGAAGAAALSLILLILGTGLGLTSVSPWAQDGISAGTFGVSAVVWVTFTQLLASGLGGYLAGRLRTRWAGAHVDEVYFRDTAHGFLAWAVASLATAALLTSVIGSIASGGIQAGALAAGGVTATAAATAGGAAAGGAVAARSETAKPDADKQPMGYFVDSLFRPNTNAPAAGSAPAGNAAAPGEAAQQAAAASSSEVTRIFVNGIAAGALPPEDVRYVGQLVAQRTGLSQQEAEKRVTDTYARLQAKLRDMELAAKQAADKARKASAYTSLWLFLSLLIGAFVASLAATYGGRLRDA
jgi:hypothetical protein